MCYCTCTYTNYRPPPACSSNFGIGTLREQLYVAGGYYGMGTTTNCERFEPRNNQWSALPDMHSRRSALAMCVLEGECLSEALLLPAEQ